MLYVSLSGWGQAVPVEVSMVGLYCGRKGKRMMAVILLQNKSLRTNTGLDLGYLFLLWVIFFNWAAWQNNKMTVRPAKT